MWIMIVIVIVSLVHPVHLSAQSIWVDRGTEKTLSLEILKPNWGGDKDSASDWAFFLSHYSLGKVSSVAELPFAISDEGKVLGNPYLGFEIHKEESPFFTELGVRLPLITLMSSVEGIDTQAMVDAQEVGTLTDVDRLEAFGDVLSITGGANYRQTHPSGYFIWWRGGPSLIIETTNFSLDDFGDRTDLLLHYSVQIGYETKGIRLKGYEIKRMNFKAGLTGAMIVTEGDMNFGERTFHQIGFAASIDSGNMRPGFYVRLPLDDDLKEDIDFVFGFHLSVQLK